MSKGGYNRKPNNLKILEGRDRNLNNPPRPAGGFSKEAPDYLPNYAKMFWDRNVPVLLKCKLLTAADYDTFCVMALIFNTICQAEKCIDEEGIIVDGARGGKVKNPAFSILNQARQQYRQFAESFGLCPGGRDRLNVPEPLTDEEGLWFGEPEPDQISKLINEREAEVKAKRLAEAKANKLES